MAIHIKLFPLVLLSLAVVFLLWLPYYVYMLGPATPVASTLGPAEPVSLIISKVEGLRAISTELERRELVKSAQFFRLYSFFTGRAHQLKPGVYEISPASTTPEIDKQLVS